MSSTVVFVLFDVIFVAFLGGHQAIFKKSNAGY